MPIQKLGRQTGSTGSITHAADNVYEQVSVHQQTVARGIMAEFNKKKDSSWKTVKFPGAGDYIENPYGVRTTKAFKTEEKPG